MKRARFIAAGVGIGLAVAAIATGNRWIAWAAIAALATALILRIIIRQQER